MSGRIFATVPAGVEQWPARPERRLYGLCPACGGLAPRYGPCDSDVDPHVHAADANAVRKRICFGRLA
jgi:hypothetical protein